MRRRRLGSELRKLRVDAGLKLHPAAERLRWSPSKVSRIERGQVAASTQDVKRMLELYGASDDQRQALIQVATKAQERSWWQAYGDTLVVPLVGLEEAAVAIRTYEAIVVPGLFQTAGYARAILRSARPDMSLEQFDRWVELRMARRDFLFGRTDPPMLTAVIDEAVLRRPVGNPEVMAQQLERLLEIAKRPGVSLRVLPFAAGVHPAMNGAFTIFSFDYPDEPEVVYLEHKTRDLYLDYANEVQRYAETFDDLCRLSLEPSEAISFLAAIA